MSAAQSTGAQADLLCQSRQPDGQPPSGVGDRGHGGEPARPYASDPGRGLCRSCARPARCRTIPADHPQVIRMRTFSKGYGLAGARVGYAITNPELALGLRQGARSFRDGAGVSGRGAGGAGGSGLAGSGAGRGRLLPARGCRRSPRPTACGPCPRPPTSSPWTAGATVTTPAARSGRVGRAGGLHPDAGRRPPGPLHPHQSGRRSDA